MIEEGISITVRIRRQRKAIMTGPGQLDELQHCAASVAELAVIKILLIPLVSENDMLSIVNRNAIRHTMQPKK